MANKKRKEMTLARYSDLSLSNAREEAAIKMKQFRDGLDPLIAKKRAQQAELNTVNNLFIDWHVGNIKRLKHPEIPKRIYRKDIAPHIGDFRIDSVTARDIRAILNTIAASGRPAIANDALMYCKQLFNHGIKLDLLSAKPASAFLVSHAGGVEKSKDRALTIEELTQFFKVARENSDSLSRENYLACALLVTLGVRKSELVEAKWNEFDLDKKVWNLPKELSKSGIKIDIPLPDIVLTWIEDLEVRAFGSEYQFPRRRTSKNHHMGKDTLNRAITKLFGHEAGKKIQPPKLMGDIEHFTVHDLRRTLLDRQGTSSYVVERCLNHKLKGVEGVYDRCHYFDERAEAINKLSQLNSSILEFNTNSISNELESRSNGQ